MLIRRAVAAAAGLVVSGALVSCSSDDDIAAGGTEDVEVLALGTAADVDFYPPDGGTDPVGSGTVAITGVREGAVSDLRDAGYTLDADQEASTPYYVDVRFENTGTTPVEPARPGGLDASDGLILPLTLIDLSGTDFELCPGVPDKVRPGATATGCSILLVPSGSLLERVYYLPGASVDDLYWEAG